MPNQISDINTSPLTTDDRLIFNLIDISARFHSFKKEVNNSIQQGITITVEEHLQHLLALSSILLLKPARTHKDLHAYIDLNTCDELCHHIIENHKTTNQLFPTEVKLQLEEIMLQLDVDGDRGKACTRLAASRQISALIRDDDVLNPVNRILLSIRNMVEKLPRRIIENGPKETELITRHLKAIISPLFEDLDSDIAFRWTSVSDDEKVANIRPDASINIIHGALLSDRIGCGEVKAQYQALSHRLIGIDLARVTTLAKDASDKHKLKSIFSFLVVGKSATFYIFDRAEADLYTMCEIAHILLPFSLDQVPLFISQLNKVIKVISCFQSVLNRETHDFTRNPVTLSDHTMHQITDAKISNKRKPIFSHYSH